MQNDFMRCCCDDDWRTLPCQIIFTRDQDAKQEREKASADILAFYKQLRLQSELENVKGLDENTKKNLLYSNGRLLSDTARKIDLMNVDLPKTYQTLTNDQNTISILQAVQMRSQHLNSNPLG